ncbi:MAG: hypothetical protein ABEJ70_08685 [Halobacteriaceae archaeon]
MDRHIAAVVLLGLLAVLAAAVSLPIPGSPSSDPLDADRTYPAGAGPDHVNVTALAADDASVSNVPREHWDSYAISYSAPPERRLVEGEYYVDATTGEIIGDRWHDATVYVNGSTYAFVQPADGIPEHRRGRFRSDTRFVYDDATDAYYRYDPHYGRVAPTNIGRHTAIVDAYRWEAVDTTTHHGVPVITYRVTGTRPNVAEVPPAINGTLELGVDEGVVYAYDLTLDADGETSRYTYDVHPAPFPEHEWVDRARDLAGNATRG